MYNLLISVAVGLLTFVGSSVALGGESPNYFYGIAPGILVFAIVYIVLARRTFKQLESKALEAQAALERRDSDAAIAIFESARPLGKWQFLVEPQIDAQIGSVYFLLKDFKKAEPFLKKGHLKAWTAQAQLGVLYFKHRDYTKMVAAFEDACKANKKQPLLWNVYAYCQADRGLTDEAISILSRCSQNVPDDDKTKANLLALQNKRRMKMRGWDMMWYQFHLDRPPAPSITQYQNSRSPFKR